MGKPRLRIYFPALPNPVGKFPMCTWSNPKIRILANLNTVRIFLESWGTTFCSIELLLLSVVAYLIAADQLTAEGEPLKRLQTELLFCPLRLNERCGALGLRSRWETAGAWLWLTMEGAPVDAVGGRVASNEAARGCSRGHYGDPSIFRRLFRARPSMPVLPSTCGSCGWTMRLANPLGLKKICETNAVRNPLKLGYHFSAYPGNRQHA